MASAVEAIAEDGVEDTTVGETGDDAAEEAGEDMAEETGVDTAILVTGEDTAAVVAPDGLSIGTTLKRAPIPESGVTVEAGGAGVVAADEATATAG